MEWKWGMLMIPHDVLVGWELVRVLGRLMPWNIASVNAIDKYLDTV